MKQENQCCIETRKAEREKIYNEFICLWSCLKFEKHSSKVIGYTFKKEDIDKFKQSLTKKDKEER